MRPLLLVAVAPLLLAAGCNRAPPKAPPPNPAEVDVSTPVTRDVTDFEEFTGHVEAVDSVDIRARVTGYLEKANFKEGNEVKEGDLLFVIDPRPYDAMLRQADASVLQAQARLKQAEADVKRNEPLVRSGATPQADFDKFVADRDVAAATVESAKAAVVSAKLNVDFCRISAPFGGRISRRFVDPGNLVQADNTILTSIVTLDPIYAYFDVDERTVLKFRRLIREGKIKSARETEVPIWLGLADEPGYSRQGVINFADNKIDAATGTLRVRGLFKNEDRVLSPGLFVRVRLPVGVAHQALMVPEQALGTDQGQKYVYVVNDQNEVEYRPVGVGSMHEGLRVVVPEKMVRGQDGQVRPAQPDELDRAVDSLTPKDRVVVRGLQRVRPGGPKVQPKLVPMPARNPAVVGQVSDASQKRPTDASAKRR